MRKRILLFLSALLLSLVILSSNLTVIFEPYSIFSYMENYTLKGLAVDIVKGISEEIGEEIDVEFTQWEEAYSRVNNGGDIALAAIAMNAERKDLFQWVGPFSIIKTNIYGKSLEKHSFESLEEAKKAPKICVVKDYYSTQYLQEKGFDNLAIYNNEKEAFKAFLTNEEYLFTTDNVSLSILIKESLVPVPELDSLITYSMDYIYMGFSKEVNAEQVQSWQNGLDEMKTNGKLNDIYQKWLPGTQAPGKYTFVAEANYSPLTYADRLGRATGFVSDIVKEIKTRMGNDDSIMVLDWDLIYRSALLNPNVVIFSIAKTDDRTPLFNWVGPVVQNNAYLYKNAASNMAVPSVEYAKQVKSIATTSSWWMEQLLVDMGFDNLISYPAPTQCVKQLMERKVDLTVLTDLTVKDIVTEAGYSINQIEPALHLATRDVYVAISKGTSNEFIDNFRATFDELVADGTYETLYSEYFE
jgi:polar amino acid transport system substrate-binding protein